MTFLISFRCHLSSFCSGLVAGWLISACFDSVLEFRWLRRRRRFHFGRRCCLRHSILLRLGPLSLRRCYRLHAWVFSFLFCAVWLFVFQVQFSLILPDLQAQNLRRHSLAQRCQTVSHLRQYQHARPLNSPSQSWSCSLALAPEQFWFCSQPFQLSMLFLISLMLYSF